MNSKFVKTIGKFSMAIFALVVSVSNPAIGQDFQNSVVKSEASLVNAKNANRLEGVWELTITFRNCETNEARAPVPV